MDFSFDANDITALREALTLALLHRRGELGSASGNAKGAIENSIARLKRLNSKIENCLSK
ncbi:MAG: hypothetical protein FWC70_00630 [Defluviitaleaceae bacterium]|nr:hypothetical protein [Defluviitaleaceae bacterium]